MVENPKRGQRGVTLRDLLKRIADKVAYLCGIARDGSSKLMYKDGSRQCEIACSCPFPWRSQLELRREEIPALTAWQYSRDEFFL